jgi:TolB-like protein
MAAVASGAALPVAPAIAAPDPARSLVVTPFANLSGDPAQDDLADVFTDELTTVLARTPGSFVIARNTAFTLKGKPIDAKAIGGDLGVRYVLQGSLKTSGERTTIEAALIDAGSGERIWAEPFDVVRADLMRAPDAIVTHLAPALAIAPADAEAARLNRPPAANAAAEDFALRCTAAVERGGFLGAEAEATFHLCQQALDADPDNVRALSYLTLKFWFPVGIGRSADPKADLAQAGALADKALKRDPNYAPAHAFRATILELQGRLDEAIAEDERALALDPATVDADAHLGWTYLSLGQFDRSIEHFDLAIRRSPHDPGIGLWYSGDAAVCFGAKRYDQAMAWARRAIAINPYNVFAHGEIIASLELTDRDAEAREALQRYLAVPLTGVSTIVGFKALIAQITTPRSDPRTVEGWARMVEGLRKAGLAENLKGGMGRDPLLPPRGRRCHAKHDG